MHSAFHPVVPVRELTNVHKGKAIRNEVSGVPKAKAFEHLWHPRNSISVESDLI